MAITDEEKLVIEAIGKCLEEPATLYRTFFEKRFGKILDKKHGDNWPFEMAEITAREILDRKDFCTNTDSKLIPEIPRKQSYYIRGHEKLATLAKGNTPNKYYTEKLEAKRFYGRNLADIGKIIDFETPLKGKKTDKGVGKIDLLAYNEGKNPPVLTLLEYKVNDTPETLLRCVLEIYTYLNQVNKKRLAEDFSESPNEGFPISKFKVDKNSEVKAAVFVHKGSLPDKHFRMGENTHIRKLMRELQVGFVSIDAEFDGENLVKIESVKVKVEVV